MAKRKTRSKASGKSRAKSWSSKIHYALIAAALLLILIPMLNKTPNPEVADRTAAVAGEFLELVDDGAYGRSWEVASPLLKDRIDEAEWQKQLAELRGRVGPVVERTPDDITLLDSPADLPTGEYVVITYDTAFRQRPAVTETVTLHHDDRSGWQVAGYHLN